MDDPLELMSKMLAETWANARSWEREREVMGRGRGDDAKSIQEVAGFLEFHRKGVMKLGEFHAWLDEQVENIPPEYRDTAEVVVGLSYSFEDTDPEIEVVYYRPETADEIAERAAAWEAAETRAAEQRRAQYEALRGEFDAQGMSGSA